MVEKVPLTTIDTIEIGSTGMPASNWCAIVALWYYYKEGHGTRAQSARTYSFKSRILPTHGIQGYAALVVGAPGENRERCIVHRVYITTSATKNVNGLKRRPFPSDRWIGYTNDNEHLVHHSSSS